MPNVWWTNRTWPRIFRISINYLNLQFHPPLFSGSLHLRGARMYYQSVNLIKHHRQEIVTFLIHFPNLASASLERYRVSKTYFELGSCFLITYCISIFQSHLYLWLPGDRTPNLRIKTKQIAPSAIKIQNPNKSMLRSRLYQSSWKKNTIKYICIPRICYGTKKWRPYVCHLISLKSPLQNTYHFICLPGNYTSPTFKRDKAKIITASQGALAKVQCLQSHF